MNLCAKWFNRYEYGCRLWIRINRQYRSTFHGLDQYKRTNCAREEIRSLMKPLVNDKRGYGRWGWLVPWSNEGYLHNVFGLGDDTELWSAHPAEIISIIKPVKNGPDLKVPSRCRCSMKKSCHGCRGFRGCPIYQSVQAQKKKLCIWNMKIIFIKKLW